MSASSVVTRSKVISDYNEPSQVGRFVAIKYYGNGDYTREKNMLEAIRSNVPDAPE